MKLIEPTTKSRYTIEALARGLEVLSLFTAARPALSFNEIVEQLGLAKSTVFRILATLEQLGYLQQDVDTRRYRPGLQVFQLGFAALAGLEIQQLAHPYLERLAQQLNETVSMAVLEDLDIIYIDRIRNRAIVGIVLGVGSRLPAHSASPGKVLLAALPEPELLSRLARAELTRLTEHTLADRAALLAELAAIRQQGYALSDQELAIGLRGAAAPIYDRCRQAVAAINVSGPISSISAERLQHELRPAVVATAAQISRTLGYTPEET
ncbi:MAG: IclR family transcriptional regulator [Chloroflexi bacterium SZAS-1]|nr:IclR family transcriptional regulator [Chloroflexi bacterium SZAS-1]HNP86212.1 IclR family transcriptional regulator [Kouleothrix sp.]